MRPLCCRQARWVRRLVGGVHGDALAAEIEAEFVHRRQIDGVCRRRWALLSLWAELSPRLIHFAAAGALARSHRAPRSGGLMDSLAYMVRSAVRSLRRRPAFTAVVVGTLALGIGANTAIFSAVNGVLLRPLPYSDAQALVTVSVAPDGPEDTPGSMSYPDITDLREDSPSLTRLVGWSATTATLTGLEEPTLIAAARVSAGLLATFALAPELGRDIRADEFGADAATVVVISHALWQQRFGGSPAVLGTSIVLNGVPFEIVGVAPADFDYPSRADLWYPRRIDPDDCARGCHTWQTIGRLADGATLASARAEAEGIAANLSAAFPATNRDKGLLVRSLREEMVGEVSLGLWVLLGAVGAVLLIACANVANLMLAHAATRRGEVALRAALGATPRQLAGTLMIESGLLAMMGAAAGLLLARGGVEILRRLSTGNLPRAEMIDIDATVLLFTLCLAGLVALLFGLSPALQLARVPLSAGLNATARGSDLAAGSRTMRAGLTAAQMCVSVVLLVAAGLLLKTFIRLYDVDPGFETRRILRFSLSLPPARYPELDQIRTTFRGIEANIAALPGVEAVGSVYGAPMHDMRTAGGVIVEGAEPPPAGRENGAAVRPVSPSYLQTMRIPLLAGRGLDAADDSGNRDVAVVNETFVRENFPGRDPRAGACASPSTWGSAARTGPSSASSVTFGPRRSRASREPRSTCRTAVSDPGT